MKFILQIEVDSFEEAEQIVASLRHSASPAAVAQVEAQVQVDDAGPSDAESPAKKYFPETTNVAAEPEAPKRRGRPRKEQAAPLVVQEEAHEAAMSSGDPEKSEPEQPLSIDHVREALRGVQANGIGDVPKQLALLQKYGAQRVTELKPENYADFIADCKAA